MSPAPFRRHRALALLATHWPALQGGEPLELASLAAILGAVEPGLQVVRQTPAHRSYEAAVAAGEVPTRVGSWHDVFNVLAFASFPTAKLALHRRVLALQHERRARQALAGSRANDRGREEDALALLDECALVIAGRPDAIAAYEAAELGPLDALDSVVHAMGVRARVLGHALHEHLVLERPPISTTRVTVALAGEFSWARVDAALAERIAAGGFPQPQRAARLPWPDARIDAWLD